MLQNNVLNNSQAEHYSQVHITPKPGGKLRFCINHRRLNMLCRGMGWPIPNIKHMIQRLGSKRPKYFAKIDLTSGYHQAPLHEKSRTYTAFITFMGVFEWLRVPIGLKGAPAYFQSILATIVLAGLLYYICELYTDDIIVYAKLNKNFYIENKKS